MGDQSFTLREYGFLTFCLLWHLWHLPWPDDIHIQTWPVFPGDTSDVQIRTSYMKAFKSYHLKQTDRHDKTIYHAASWVVNNVQHKYYKILHKTTERHLQTITSSHCSLVKTLQITQQCCTTLENSLLIQHISIIYTVQYSRNEIRWWW